MNSSWVTRPVLRVRSAFRVAFTEDHPPQWIASSFALGIFVTALPTLGTGLPVLAWASHRFVWANKIAFVAAVAVLNPLVKSGVYAGSLLIGIQLLGPVSGSSNVDIGLDAGADVLVRLLVGNVILAVALMIVGYAVAYRTAHAVRRRRL
ncbi:hypothetical protein C491_17122 [Natronococcus amylolyticus DSM 10524]|uniref:DUF2062 domain-containing protein n=1 Tax=Natronococcus amylolyticus DSM 10524 TaxID=1227497 RepID=L9X1W8_9EURY|nr:DUF2062 domain-containing protein [Natronococcus amylolyticus]ELY55456.1 hypothetical protein C491_17122 [Natronococcus amylolyticus DSM 10524]